jgi:hypothetical protein
LKKILSLFSLAGARALSLAYYPILKEYKVIKQKEMRGKLPLYRKMEKEKKISN